MVIGIDNFDRKELLVGIDDFEEKYGDVVDEQELLDIIEKEIAQIKTKGGLDMEEKLQRVYAEQEKIQEFFRRYEEDKDISINELKQEFDDLKSNIEMIEGIGTGQKIIDVIQQIEEKNWKVENGVVEPFYVFDTNQNLIGSISFARKNHLDKIVLEEGSYSLKHLLNGIYLSNNSWKAFGEAVFSILEENKSFLDKKDQELLLDFLFNRIESLGVIDDTFFRSDKENGYYSFSSSFVILKDNPKYFAKLFGKIKSVSTGFLFNNILDSIGDNQQFIDDLMEKSKDVEFSGEEEIYLSVRFISKYPQLEEFVLSRIKKATLKDSRFFVKLLKYPEILEEYGYFSNFEFSLSNTIEDIDNIIGLVSTNDFAFVYALISMSKQKKLQQIILEKAKDLKITHKGAYQMYQNYKNVLTKSVIDEIEKKNENLII